MKTFRSSFPLPISFLFPLRLWLRFPLPRRGRLVLLAACLIAATAAQAAPERSAGAALVGPDGASSARSAGASSERSAGAAPARPVAAEPRGFTPKLTPPIEIAHAFARPPAVGEPLVITLSVRAGEFLGDATLALSADQALTILAPQTSVGLGPLAAGETAAVEVSVLPLEAGTQYLRVEVAGELRGQPQSRSIAIPIRLESAEPRKSEAQTTGKLEQSVRSFRAIETVR